MNSFASHMTFSLLAAAAWSMETLRPGRDLHRLLEQNESPGKLYVALSLIIRHFNPMAKTSKAAKKKRTPNAAFMKPVTPDQKLALVIGEKPLPRTELTKKLWAYIRKNGLQDKKVRTQINADENLKAVFNGKKSVSMFEMTKLVSGHVKK
ncbi:MAG: SWIB/MDM2 domain-containing protein [Limisphaerales bacterium]